MALYYFELMCNGRPAGMLASTYDYHNGDVALVRLHTGEEVGVKIASCKCGNGPFAVICTIPLAHHSVPIKYQDPECEICYMERTGKAGFDD